MRTVLVVGPSIDRTKGGMSTVIKSQLNSNPTSYGYNLEILVSHVEGPVLEKIKYLLSSSAQLLRKRGLSLVHIHVAADASFYRKSILAQISRLKGIPVLMHVHGSDFDEFYERSNWVCKYWIRRTFASCTRTLLLSAYWHRFFFERITIRNLEILHNGVEVSTASAPSTSRTNLNNFLFLGRLGVRKGIYDLLEAIKIIVNEKGYSELMFVLAGDGDLSVVSEIIEKHGLQNNTKVLGWVSAEARNECLANVSTVILPSYSEGLPMALLEAVSLGKVVISSAVGGIPDLIEEGKNGFLITPGDVNAIVHRVIHVVNNWEEVLTISASNKIKIEKYYNAARLNRRLFSIYNEALTKK